MADQRFYKLYTQELTKTKIDGRLQVLIIIAIIGFVPTNVSSKLTFIEDLILHVSRYQDYVNLSHCNVDSTCSSFIFWIPLLQIVKAFCKQFVNESWVIDIHSLLQGEIRLTEIQTVNNFLNSIDRLIN